MSVQNMNATEFLQAAIDTQAERGKQYDSPEGERSMGRTVQAFNAITGRDLTEAEGWLLLQTLKDVRQWQNPDKYHHDSALDGVAYASLKAEALCNAPRPIDPNAAEVKMFPFTMPRLEDDWIEHGGVWEAAPRGSEVFIRTRRGSVSGPIRLRDDLSSSCWAWASASQAVNDIVAYRLA
jgi:hypothetical protein